MRGRKGNIKIFIDFDGTITTEDVGEKLFVATTPAEVVQPILEEIKTKQITAKEGWKKLFEVSPVLTGLKLLEIANTTELDQGFLSFLNYCHENKFDVYILSDGFDEYIRPILTKFSVTGVKVYSNHLSMGVDGKLNPVFPYTDEECQMCANCKRNHLISKSADDDITFYIGNGSSDTCPVNYADYVFAKDFLLKYCEKERITFFPYRNFIEIQKKFTELISKNRLKKRSRAETLRKQLYKLG